MFAQPSRSGRLERSLHFVEFALRMFENEGLPGLDLRLVFEEAVFRGVC